MSLSGVIVPFEFDACDSRTLERNFRSFTKHTLLPKVDEFINDFRKGIPGEAQAHRPDLVKLEKNMTLIPCDRETSEAIFFFIFHSAWPGNFPKFKKHVNHAVKNSMDLSRKYLHDTREISFLHYAIEHNSTSGNKAAIHLVKKGARLGEVELGPMTMQSVYGRSYMENYPEFIDAISKITDINHAYENGSTVLTHLCERTFFFNGELKTFETMLEKGANPDYVHPKTGNTPFHDICIGMGFVNRDDEKSPDGEIIVKRNLSLVELFLQHGADIHLKNREGKSCHGILSESIDQHVPEDKARIMDILNDNRLEGRK